MSNFKIGDEVVVVGKTCSTYGQVGRVVRTRVGHRCDKVSITINGTNVFTMLPHNLEHVKKNSAPVVDQTHVSLSDSWPKMVITAVFDDVDFVLGDMSAIDIIKYWNKEDIDSDVEVFNSLDELREFVENESVNWEIVSGIIDNKPFVARQTTKYEGIDI